VVRSTEPDFDLLECFNPATDKCVISRSCSLKGVLFNAQAGFLGVLDKYTLADIAKASRKVLPAFKSIPITSAYWFIYVMPVLSHGQCINLGTTRCGRSATPTTP
jgi:hypothetical protein